MSGTFRCPTCGAPVTLAPRAPAFPFCSPRCRNADLNRWLNGNYALDPATGKLDVVDPATAEDVTATYQAARDES